MTAVLAFILTAFVTWLVTRDHYATDLADARVDRDKAIRAANHWHDRYLAVIGNVTPLRSVRQSPAFDRIADQLARNEASRDLGRLDEVAEQWRWQQ